MEIHALFPTLLLQDDNLENDRLKNIILKNMLKHTDADGFSGEFTGHVNLHHEPLYEQVFVMATHMAKQYCEVMQIDPDLFDFNIVKSWFNILENQSTPYHSHADAHLSFCYYVHVPEDLAQPIRFYAKEDKYEPFPAFAKFNSPAEWNIFNSYSWSFQASEGRMYLWPARMGHDTVGKSNDQPTGITSVEEAKKRRVSLAGDILLTYKEKSRSPLGLQPKRNWRLFG
jgi:hypothetical protein